MRKPAGPGASHPVRSAGHRHLLAARAPGRDGHSGRRSKELVAVAGGPGLDGIDGRSARRPHQRPHGRRRC